MGFTKLDSGIIQSSIMAEDGNTFKVWIAMLATCESDGISKTSEVFLSSVCRLTMTQVVEAIKKLEAPDVFSRSTNDEGKRIERVDGGFRIINYHKYRDYTYSDNPESVRKRIYREKNRDNLGHVPKMAGHSASASSSYSEKKEEECEKKPFDIAINNFVEFRKKIKRPLTDHARSLLIKKLDQLAPRNQEKQIKILDQSILRGWQGVFPLQDEDTKPQPNIWTIPEAKNEN
jgi:hypothetical protein